MFVKLSTKEVADSIADKLISGVRWPQFDRTIYGWLCDQIQTHVKVLYVCPDKVGDSEAIEVVHEYLSDYGEVKSIKWGIFDQFAPHVTDGTIHARMVFGPQKPPNWVRRDETLTRNAEVWQIIYKGQGPSGCWACGDLNHIGQNCRTRIYRTQSKNNYRGAKRSGVNQIKSVNQKGYTARENAPNQVPSIENQIEFPELNADATTKRIPGLSPEDHEAALNAQKRKASKKVTNSAGSVMSDEESSTDDSGKPPAKVQAVNSEKNDGKPRSLTENNKNKSDDSGSVSTSDKVVTPTPNDTVVQKDPPIETPVESMETSENLTNKLEEAKKKLQAEKSA